MLSAQLRRFYTFKSETRDYLRLPEVEMMQAVDATGDYTKALLSQNWGAPTNRAR